MKARSKRRSRKPTATALLHCRERPITDANTGGSQLQQAPKPKFWFKYVIFVHPALPNPIANLRDISLYCHEDNIPSTPVPEPLPIKIPSRTAHMQCSMCSHWFRFSDSIASDWPGARTCPACTDIFSTPLFSLSSPSSSSSFSCEDNFRVLSPASSSPASSSPTAFLIPSEHLFPPVSPPPWAAAAAGDD